MPTTRVDQLDQAIATLDELATPSDSQTLTVLRGRLRDRRLRILVAGEAKRGKSTLVNRLLQRDVLPTGVTPVTAIATTVRRSDDNEHIIATTVDGRRAAHPLGALADYVTERGNPGNTRQVRDVEVALRAPLLDRYPVEIVDTPGTGSVFAHNTSTAETALETLDAVIFTLTADPPISAAERDLLSRVAELSVHTIVVLNKADQLDADELAEAQQFTAEVCAAAAGHDLPIYPCSARAGTRDAGYRHFAETIEQYLAQRAEIDATTAIRGHLARLATAMLDSALLTERSLQLAAASSAGRVALFRDRLQEIDDRRSTFDDQCASAERRTRRSLDRAAIEQVAQLTEHCRKVARTALDGPLRELDPGALELHGREVVVTTIREAAERWRGEQARALEAELGALTTRAITDLNSRLADLRDAARELLNVELSVQAIPRPLRPSQRFWYDFSRGVGVEPPLADVARALLPGRVKRVRARLLDEVPHLVDRQLGRARSDLAQRLHESVRDVIAQLRTEQDEVLNRIRAALDEAGVLSEQASDERHRRRAELATRITSLSGVVDELREEDR